MRSFGFALALLVSTASVAAEPTPSVDADVATIRTVTVVSDGHDGRAGTTPESVHAFRRLVRSPGAAERFAELLKDATPAGRLFALCGLYFTDPEAFRSALPAFERSEERVRHQAGCMISEEPVADLIHSPYAPVIRIEPGASPDGTERGSWDIAGGGFCHLIKGTLWPASR